MTTFLLIHGSWHGGWCWRLLDEALRKRGHQVIAPDLPGMGDDRAGLGAATLEGWAQFVADLARSAGGDVVLVGHSRGGAVISQAAETAPDAFRGLIYVTGLLLEDGQPVMSLAHHMSAGGVEAMRAAEDGSFTTLDPGAAGPLLYNTTAPDLAAWAVGHLGPDPTLPNITPVTLSAARFGSLPRAFVECARDETLSLALQQLMQAAMPCDPVIRLDTDHSPFLSAPEALADALCGIAQAFADRQAVEA